jgi:hypothetical protein
MKYKTTSPLPYSVPNLGEAFSWGKKLDTIWPGQDAFEFAYAVVYNDHGPLKQTLIADLELTWQGSMGGDSWFWNVFTTSGEGWLLEAACTNGSWPTSSSSKWTKYESH